MTDIHIATVIRADKDQTWGIAQISDGRTIFYYMGAVSDVEILADGNVQWHWYRGQIYDCPHLGDEIAMEIKQSERRPGSWEAKAFVSAFDYWKAMDLYCQRHRKQLEYAKVVLLPLKNFPGEMQTPTGEQIWFLQKDLKMLIGDSNGMRWNPWDETEVVLMVGTQVVFNRRYPYQTSATYACPFTTKEVFDTAKIQHEKAKQHKDDRPKRLEAMRIAMEAGRFNDPTVKLLLEEDPEAVIQMLSA